MSRGLQRLEYGALMVGTQRVVSRGRVSYKSESFRDEWLPEVGSSITVGEGPANPDRHGYPRNGLQS